MMRTWRARLGAVPTALQAAPLVLLTAVAVLAGTGAGSAFAQAKPEGKPGGHRQLPAALVVVAPVDRVREPPQVEFTGLVEPATRVLLSSDVAGKVVRLRRREGDVVAAEEVLAVLDNPTMALERGVLQARLAESKARLAQSKQQQQRLAILFGQKLTSAQKYEDGKAALAVAEAEFGTNQAQVERLEEQLKRMVLRAPLGGQIVKASVDLGQWVTPNQPLFEIYNFERYEVRVGVPGRYLTAVPYAGVVDVFLPELEQRLTGEILSVVQHVSSDSGNFALRVSLSNPSGLPLSGMVARVRLPLEAYRSMLTVPRDAIVRQGDRTHVVRVEDNKAQIVLVQVRGSLGDSVIVVAKDLRPLQLVVIRGNESLLPGAAVRVFGTEPPASAAPAAGTGKAREPSGAAKQTAQSGQSG